jgi:hypothetical protein
MVGWGLVISLLLHVRNHIHTGAIDGSCAGRQEATRECSAIRPPADRGSQRLPQGSPLGSPQGSPQRRPQESPRGDLPQGSPPRDTPREPPPEISPGISPGMPPHGSPACIRQGSLPGGAPGGSFPGIPQGSPADHPWTSYSPHVQPQRGQMPPRSCAILFCIVATPGGLVSWTVSDKTVGDGGRFSQGTVWWGSVCSGVVERARIW